MRNLLGGLLLGIGMIGMFGIWIFTTVFFFSTGQTLLALLSLFVPPADIVLPFLISPAWGLLGIGSLAVAFAGSAIRQD
jgi:hypothetical protein